MANTKASPAKFITALFGGAQLRREQRAANEDMNNQMDNWEDTKMKNPYAGVKNPYENLENVYEDAQVNLKQAEFEKEQSQQSMANVMSGMQGAAGGSGVAGLAQVLANQGVKQAQQSSLSIGAQEQQNQQKMVAESGRLQQMKVEGEQKRDMLTREGQKEVVAYDMDKQAKMLDLSMQRSGAANDAVDQQNQAIDAMFTGAVQAGLGVASGGLSSIATK
tara:strand:- start:229 stop:888 length:660 start_codon:yes stop_codon:yes gene_type:complete